MKAKIFMAQLQLIVLDSQIILNNNAYGGCLGRKYRRRTYMVAISSEKLPRSFDPEISEWSNPLVRGLLSEFIG
jgi:hypothetical protein